MYKFKVVLMGDGGVGKTTLRKRFMGEVFRATYIMTIGADFAAKTIEVDGRQMRFIIWDLAGQPHFKQVRKAFYVGAVGGLLVYDVTRRETFEHIPCWLEEFISNCGRGRDAVAAVLIGNKIDLREGARNAVSPEEGAEMRDLLAEQYGIPLDFVETSAKTGENVEKAFMMLAQELLRLGIAT